MKFIVVMLLSFITLSAWGGEGICSQMHHSDKDLLKKALDKKYSCQLEWKDKKGRQGAEVLLLHKYCIQMEGGYPEDCLLGRTCAKSETQADYGVPLYLKKEVLSYVCAAGDRYLLGNEGEKGEVAIYIKCNKGKMSHIELVSPSGAKKSCPLPN